MQPIGGAVAKFVWMSPLAEEEEVAEAAAEAAISARGTGTVAAQATLTELGAAPEEVEELGMLIDGLDIAELSPALVDKARGWRLEWRRARRA